MGNGQQPVISKEIRDPSFELLDRSSSLHILACVVGLWPEKETAND